MSHIPTLYHLWQSGKLPTGSSALESWHCTSPAVVLRKAGSASPLISTADLALEAGVWMGAGSSTRLCCELAWVVRGALTAGTAPHWLQHLGRRPYLGTIVVVALVKWLWVSQPQG